MKERMRIAAALDGMETVSAAMARDVDAADMDQRARLVAHRRALAQCFVDLNGAVDEAIAAGRVAPDAAGDYHARFAAFRRAVALHQAEWPAILISDNVAGYLAASRELRIKRESFMTFMREQFLRRVGPA